ncbi:MAG: PQQ-like beta-propeller repeat protein [Candidatus Bathyarchaeota archaeon]|nr:PQQ-like beta-propeller repeat protein [Candidatus Bathyarchaeota archaeon]
MIDFGKKLLATVAIFLMLTVASSLIALPATAHDPPWVFPTWTYIAVSPNPIGVGQQALVVFWLDKLPQTASGEYGDRFTFYVDVTKPGGTNETLGPFTSDPVGGSYTIYTPDEVGDYTFVARFPGHTYTGLPAAPSGIYNPLYVNDTLLPSVSPPVTLTVQQEPIPGPPGVPLPEDYWTRPIYATNRAWSVIAGNWLGGGNPIGNFNPYSKAPGTAHIVWAKPTTFGGIVGEPYDEISYHTGSAYETFWSAGIIIGGRLYYNEPKAPRYGWYCVDLRTGEQIFYQNSTGPIQIGSQTPAHIGNTNIPWQYPQLSFGQIYNYQSPNQFGARAYLWSTYTQSAATTYNYTMINGTVYSFNTPANSAVWQMYDGWTGNWICNIANVPSGTRVTGPNGEILIYIYNSNGWLALWNSSVALGFPNNNLGIPYGQPGAGPGEAYYWMWREPIGRTVDGTKGYSWNVTAPANLGTISTVVQDDNYNPDRILGVNGITAFQYGVSQYSIWTLNLNQTQRGQLIWKKDYQQPPVRNATVTMGPVSLADRIFTVRQKETLQWYGYSLDTGDLVWGPTQPSEQFDLYGLGGNIAYGRLYSVGYAGVLHCYDIKTGELLWNTTLNKGGLEGPYQYWPVGSGAGVSIADRKIFVTTGEHSHTQPLYTGWSIYCFDADTGANLWNMTGLCSTIIISDGYAIAFDNMDNRIYCYGKGQTATTVETSKAGTLGTPILIEGTVTDQSPGAKGKPAIADAYMSEWMEYVYHQRTKPTNIKGVEVTVDTIDPNGNYFHIGNATTDENGMFSLMFNPEIPGIHTIIASFPGSGSYFPSLAETAVAIGEPTQQPGEKGTVPGDVTGTLALYILLAAVAIIIAIAIVGIALWRRH